MDFEPEKIHNFNLEVGLPSTLHDLKNPTEEYIINLITQFLNTCHIDLNAIKKPTSEQLCSGLLADDTAEILSLINLSEAMAGICNQIFFKDFYLTDITSPAPKKTRRLASVLSNFLLYARGKNALIEERLEEMRSKRQRLDEINKERNKYIEMRNAKALENAKKLEMNEELEAEIARMRAMRIERKAQIAAAEESLRAMEKEKLEIIKRNGKLTAKAMKMRKMTENLESKIVRSPERHQSRLKELLEQKKNQTEKREVMQEAIISKKPAIERIQKHMSVVTDAHAKFPEIIDAYKSLTTSKKALEEANKRVFEIKSLINEESCEPNQENSQTSNVVIQKTKDDCEKHLSAIRNELAELLNEKKSLECKMTEDQTRQQEIYSQRDEIRMSTKKIEKDTEEFVAGCQEFYDKEINQELKLKSALETKEP